MEKILKFLKCKDVDEVVYKMKSYEINEEIEELKNLIYIIGKEKLKNKDFTRIRTMRELIEFLNINMGIKNNEEFKVFFLDCDNKLLGEKTLFQGTVDRSTIYPRLIVEEALKYPTKGIVISHNHPSGDITPSIKDKEVTQAIKETLKNLNMSLVDHVIIGQGNHYSFLDNGIL